MKGCTRHFQRRCCERRSDAFRGRTEDDGTGLPPDAEIRTMATFRSLGVYAGGYRGRNARWPRYIREEGME